MKRILPYLLMVPLLLIAPWSQPAAAQTDEVNQPAVVISIASLDKQFSDVKHLMQKSGFGDLAPFVDAMTMEFVRGIDRRQGMGVALHFPPGSEMPEMLGYIPVTNLDDLLDTLAEQVQIDESATPIRMIAPDGSELFLRQAGGYAVIAMDAERLAAAPDDPAAFLGDLPDRYNFATKVYGQRIPEAMRQEWSGMIREGFEDSMRGLDGDVNAEQLRAQLEQIESLIEETDELMIGLQIDQSLDVIHLDFSITGLPGSNIARQATMAGEVQTRFAGFADPDAAFSMNMTSALLPEDVEQVKTSMNQVRDMVTKELRSGGGLPPDDAEVVEKFLLDFFELIEESMESGVFDMAMTGYMDATQFNLIGGARITDPMKLENMVRDIAGLLQEKAAEEGVNVETEFNHSTYAGVRMHQITVDIPDSEDEMREIFGDRMTLLIGAADEAAYFALGDTPMVALTQAIDRSTAAAAGELPAVSMHIAIAPILEFVYRLQNDRMMLDMANVLKQNESDKIKIVSDFIPNGQKMRIEIQTGLLELISLVAGQMGGGFGEDF